MLPTGHPSQVFKLSDSLKKVNICKTFLVLSGVVFLGTVVKCVFALWRETIVTITGCYSWRINIIHKKTLYFKCLLTILCVCVWLYRCCPLNVIIVQKCAVFYWWSLTSHASLSQDFETLIRETSILRRNCLSTHDYCTTCW